MQEPEQEKCGRLHYAGCACHELVWENKWKAAIEMGAHASVERDEAVSLAANLIAFVRMNAMAGKFKTATYEEVEASLAQFVDRLRELQPPFSLSNARAVTPATETDHGK